MIISILTILLLIIITGTAYSQTVNQTTENAVLKISHPFTISLFSSKLNSSSTINIFQKYLTQSNEIIIYWLQTPSYFKVENTLFPYFLNHTRAIEVPNISAIQGVINEVAPLALTKDRDLIVYDPEVWSVTPTTEYDYTQPGGKGISQSISQSADMVHLAGYLFGVAPELKGPPGPQSPSLVGHYQEIDWTKVDYLFIQSQLVINSESDLQV